MLNILDRGQSLRAGLRVGIGGLTPDALSARKLTVKAALFASLIVGSFSDTEGGSEQDAPQTQPGSHAPAVMFRGKMVEQGPASQVCDAPEHPYTQALLSAVPHPDPARRAMHQRLRYDAERGVVVPRERVRE